jgi:hypothetical protein
MENLENREKVLTMEELLENPIMDKILKNMTPLEKRQTLVYFAEQQLLITGGM